MSSFGVSMIVRDDADIIRYCLQSIAGSWDQLLVVDTGSTDGTPGIAREFGADVISLPWCDNFATARNFGWECLETDFKMWIDCDDVAVGLEHLDDLLGKLEDRALDGAVTEYLYAFDSVGFEIVKSWLPSICSRRARMDDVLAAIRPRCITTQWRERIIRNDPLWRWEGAVHEALPAAGRKLGKYEQIKVIHLRQMREKAFKGDRNLNILLKVPESQRDERTWFYLGLEYAHHGRLQEAVAAFETYLPRATVEDEKYQALHFLGDLYRTLGEQDRSIEYNLRAVGLRPTWRDAYAGLLESYVKKGDWARALYYGAQIERAEVPDTPFAFNPMHEEIGWTGDYVRTLVEVGQIDEAVRVARRAIEATPEDTAAQHNLDVLSIAKNLSVGQQSTRDIMEFLLRHDDVETAAVLVSRLAPELRGHPDLQQWVGWIDTFCGKAAAGGIAADQMKINPAATEEERMNPWWQDPRVKHLLGELGRMPEIQSVIQIGGPLETGVLYGELGVEASRIEKVEDVSAEAVADAVVLWSCLERVRDPEDLVERARRCVRPGGVLFACVPNGPSSKGLAPPRQEHLRLRAFSIDSFRKAMGTVRMPTIVPGWAAEAGDLWLTIPTPLPVGRSKTIGIVCPLAPEPWGPWSLEKGIGGSEEAVVRLSRAFVRRGHSVVVYGSGWEGTDEVSGVEYYSIRYYGRHDVLIGWRYPEIFLGQLRPLEAEWKALWLHDTIERERVARAAPLLDCVWTISDYHAGLFEGVPGVYRGRNGIDRWEFDRWADDSVQRNPAKMVWTSTPFRGLRELLEIWPEVKRRIPEAELHIFYGWESADRLGATSTPEGMEYKRRVVELCAQPGVTWRGRVGQPELYREILSAGAWAYRCLHQEESCIGAMIAQAGGAWPVVLPLGALEQTVLFGWKTTPERYVDALVSAVHAEVGRDRMMEWTRRWTSWDECAGMWERLWNGRVA